MSTREPLVGRWLNRVMQTVLWCQPPAGYRWVSSGQSVVTLTWTNTPAVRERATRGKNQWHATHWQISGLRVGTQRNRDTHRDRDNQLLCVKCRVAPTACLEFHEGGQMMVLQYSNIRFVSVYGQTFSVRQLFRHLYKGTYCVHALHLSQKN